MSTAGWPASPRTLRCATAYCSCWRWRGLQQLVPLLLSASQRFKALQVSARQLADARRPGIRRVKWPVFPFDVTVRVSLWVSVAVVAVLWTWGAWQRRWIADDGLIVLRTVRNLLAGNGPVFNAGERVESNTSTLWTYLNYVGALVAGPVQLEYVALALALSLSVAGVVLVMLGTARLFASDLHGRRVLLLPA